MTGLWFRAESPAGVWALTMSKVMCDLSLFLPQELTDASHSKMRGLDQMVVRGPLYG